MGHNILIRNGELNSPADRGGVPDMELILRGFDADGIPRKDLPEELGLTERAKQLHG